MAILITTITITISILYHSCSDDSGSDGGTVFQCFHQITSLHGGYTTSATLRCIVFFALNVMPYLFVNNDDSQNHIIDTGFSNARIH